MRPVTSRLLVTLALALSATVVAATTAGADETATHTIQYHLNHNMPADGDDPTLHFDAPVAMDDTRIILKRDDAIHQSSQLGDLEAGESVEIAIDQSQGRHHYDATISGTDDDGNDLNFEIDFDVRVTPQLEVELLRDDVDLDEGLIPVRVNRPVDEIELQIADGDGQPTVRETRSVDEQRGRIDVEFQSDDDVGEARIRIQDVDDNWTTYTLEPFWVEIPEQIINFETGTATIDDDEQQKLAETRDQVLELLEEHDDRRSNLRLYVAGYTDTVGPADRNLELSQKRARAIGQWFDDHDVDIPIYYQGFGQEALAVDTPDETEEKRNRRAVYILGNTPPQTSEDIPRSEWQRLR